MTDTIFEFRDYTLRAGQRDALIDLFEREFVEAQEILGAIVRATFRDLDHADRFVWIRSFADAHARFAALDAFYTGVSWQANRTAANATIVDSDNVLQLRPVAGAIPGTSRAAVGETASTGTLIVATIYFPCDDAHFAAHFLKETAPLLRDIRAAPFAMFATEHAPNIYPRLPIRTDTVFLTLTRYASEAAHAERRNDLDDIHGQLMPMLAAPVEIRRLQPTARSTLR